MTVASDMWRIGVDVGGTFTDLVMASASGSIRVFKVPTVPDDPSQGALNAIDRAAVAHDLPVAEFLGRCTLFVHGTTVATNTLLEGKGARVGLLTTAGFRDSLEIRRGMRDNPWDHRTPYPPVLVPRYLRLPVRGRLDRSGEEVVAIAEQDVDMALAEFDRDGVEAIAVCLFNSFLNSRHEKLVAERIRSRLPQMPISVSSQIAPIMGEYERTSTAVLNSYVSPRTLSYLRALNDRLVERGLKAPFVLIQSNGGATSVAELGERAVTLLLSGPAAGVGALNYYAEAIGSNDLISIEIGGTSCDVILMNEGKVASTDFLDIGGYKCVTPSIDVHTIGAGGGTVARVDNAGLLHVGPQGAGARPGPACYGHGGIEPTITDAHVVLGRLKAGAYADGAVMINREFAEEAIHRAVARPLGLSVEAAATGIIRLMEQKMLHAVQRVSTERGHNPEHFTLVAGGGAGPLHAVSVGRSLKCARVFVPKLSGAFCAVGMLNVNLQHDYMRVHLARLDDVDLSAVDAIFCQLAEEATVLLAREGFSDDRISLTRILDLRYFGQQWDVTVEIGSGFDPAAIRLAFEERYEQLFGHIQPFGVIEITKLRLSAKGLIQPLQQVHPFGAAAGGRPTEIRPVWISQQAGWRDTAIYSGADLLPDQKIVGPAIINEHTTTILIGVGDRLEVDQGGNYRIDVMADAPV